MTENDPSLPLDTFGYRMARLRSAWRYLHKIDNSGEMDRRIHGAIVTAIEESLEDRLNEQASGELDFSDETFAVFSEFYDMVMTYELDDGALETILEQDPGESEADGDMHVIRPEKRKRKKRIPQSDDLPQGFDSLSHEPAEPEPESVFSEDDYINAASLATARLLREMREEGHVIRFPPEQFENPNIGTYQGPSSPQYKSYASWLSIMHDHIDLANEVLGIESQIDHDRLRTKPVPNYGR